MYLHHHGMCVYVSVHQVIVVGHPCVCMLCRVGFVFSRHMVGLALVVRIDCALCSLFNFMVFWWWRAVVVMVRMTARWRGAAVLPFVSLVPAFPASCYKELRGHSFLTPLS